ncbi:unnamed protein product [Toxocara canis]|uniref:GNAT family N-acetyltransferase n=1 Tax=Toxocara canis TaxID=6265 RepID=A0A183UN20_TOXCA|nr:unnamed protein product [Toxocara canis]
MGRSVVRIIHEPTQDLIEQFATLLTADRQILCDARYSPLMRSYTLPNCHIILATPADGKHLSCFQTVIPHSGNFEGYYRGQNVGANYSLDEVHIRGRRIGHTLFDEFQRSFDHPQRIAFCDFARSERARLRPSLFPIEGRYSIRRVIGFAANIALAAGELIAAYGKVSLQNYYLFSFFCTFAVTVRQNNVYSTFIVAYCTGTVLNR